VGERGSIAIRREVDRGYVRAALFGAFIVGVGGCTLLVDFVDKAPIDQALSCEGGDCTDPDATVLYSEPDAGADAAVPDVHVEADATPNPCGALADGAACGDADPCNDPPRCEKGACAMHPKEAGVFCGHDSCNCEYCDGKGGCTDTKKCPEGFNWDPKDKLARCCGGLAVLTNTNANCGVCGVVCRTAGVSTVQSCKAIDGEYLCVGCSANPECWSKCCSSSPGPAHCAASDCSTGKCMAGICPAPSTCITGPGTSPNYCSY
jgi:hypothetical protein